MISFSYIGEGVNEGGGPFLKNVREGGIRYEPNPINRSKISK